MCLSGDDCDVNLGSGGWGFATNWEGNPTLVGQTLLWAKLVTNRDKLVLQQSEMSAEEFTSCIDVLR